MRWVVATAVVILGCWAFPPFHVVRLASPGSSTTAKGRGVSTGPEGFDAKAAAGRVWHDEIPKAATHAANVDTVVATLRKDPEAAKKQYGKAAGVGAVYFFVQGKGRIVTRERSQLRIALEGSGDLVAIRIGPVFGNTVRDGCGVLELNSFPGLAEFNALSAELNALVEKEILPILREKAQIGGTLSFAGCAEAPDFPPDAGEPVLTIVPVEAHLP